MDFVHTFSPQVTDLFGCSAALSRGLNLDHELSLARERVEERRRRLDDLEAQGGGLPEPVGEAEPPPGHRRKQSGPWRRRSAGWPRLTRT